MRLRTVAGLLGFLLMSGILGATGSSPQKNVLIFHADNPFQPANLVMDGEFRARFQAVPGLTVNLYSEYLESVRFPSAKAVALKLALLREKYGSLSPDLVLVTDDTSWDFLNREGRDLFPRVPVVFCGITQDNVDLQALRPRTTGTFKTVDIQANIALVHRLQPQVTSVAVVLGVSHQDRYYEALARRAFSVPGVSLLPVYLGGKTMEEILSAVATLPDSAVVLYVSLYQDGQGTTFNPRDALDLVAARSRVPVYGVSETYLGHGIVGGNLLSFQDLARGAADLALQVLAGRDPAELTPKVSRNRDYFDWTQVHRWGISEGRLPAGAVITSRPPDPWVLFPGQTFGLVGFCTLEFLLLLLLFVLLAQRKKVQRALSADIRRRLEAEAQLAESEARFRTLFDSSGDAIFVNSLEGRVVRVNRTACERLEYTFEELTSLSIFDLQAEDNTQNLADWLEIVRSAGHLLTETVHRTKHGTKIPTEVNAQVIELDGQKRILSIARDISARKESERARQGSDLRYRMLFEHSGTANAIYDLAGRLVLPNQLYLTTFGTPGTDLVGRTIEEIFGAEMGPVIRSRVMGVVANPNPTSFISELHTPLGTQWFHSSYAPLLDEFGTLVGTQVISQDITEARRLSEQLNHMQKMESIGVLAGGLAHDFNNLLGGLSGHIELARLRLAEGAPALALDRLEKASQVFERARSLTSQLLTFSKGGNPVQEVQMLGPRLREWAPFALSGSDLVLKLNIAADLHLCSCDVHQISQVIDNLMINARQASPPGATVTLEAENWESDGTAFLRIRVIDQGPGIPRETVSRLFEPFFTTKTGGTGLGLATSQSIAQKHRGWISVDSIPGQGSTFSLHLPALVRGQVSPSPREGLQPFRGQGRVLVMDDEESLRDAVGEYLERIGFEVTRARDGQVALDLVGVAEAEGRPFTLALLDLTVPGGLGGFEVSQRLSSFPSSVALVAMSGYSEGLDRGQLTQAGFQAVLAKPFTLEELSRHIRRVLGG